MSVFQVPPVASLTFDILRVCSPWWQRISGLAAAADRGRGQQRLHLRQADAAHAGPAAPRGRQDQGGHHGARREAAALGIRPVDQQRGRQGEGAAEEEPSEEEPPSEEEEENKEGAEEEEEKEEELDENGEPIVVKQPLYFKETDYHLRVPHVAFNSIKTLETTAMSSVNTQPKLKVHVLCSGIRYGNGERTFYDHF